MVTISLSSLYYSARPENICPSGMTPALSIRDNVSDIEEFSQQRLD